MRLQNESEALIRVIGDDGLVSRGLLAAMQVEIEPAHPEPIPHLWSRSSVAVRGSSPAAQAGRPVGAWANPYDRPGEKPDRPGRRSTGEPDAKRAL